MNRPHVIVNCAMSADGKIALPTRKQLKLSSEEDMKRVYKLRNEYDAVLVGVGTILSDDPKLTVKESYVKKPKQPIRIILDAHCKTPKNAHAVNNVTKTLIITLQKCEKNYGKHVEIIKCKTGRKGLVDLNQLLDILYKRGIKKLMVEGGGTVIWNFLNQKLVDDLYVYVSPVIVGGRYTPTMADGEGIKIFEDTIRLKIVRVRRLGKGVLFHYKMRK